MNDSNAMAKVRSCLAAIKPDVDLDTVANDTPLLEERVITSFDVLDLILHLERASGQPINRKQLVPGSFRNIATIANVFFGSENDA
jgi:acyl carrier protein